jgi:hypothetical protein
MSISFLDWKLSLDDHVLVWGMGMIFHFCHILSDSCTHPAIYPVGDGRLSIRRVKLNPQFQYESEEHMQYEFSGKSLQWESRYRRTHT